MSSRRAALGSFAGAWAVGLGLVSGGWTACCPAAAPPPVVVAQCPAPAAASASAAPSAAAARPRRSAPARSVSLVPAAPAASAPAAPPEPPAPLPAAAGVIVRCDTLCATTAKSCDAASVGKCKALCKTYVERSRGCEPEYERALDCQAAADIGELCTQVASVRCSEQFRAVRACERGEKAAPAAQAKSLASWVPLEDGTLRFRTLLPPGVERDAAANAWRSSADGILYAVTVRDAPRPPLTHVALVRLVIAFVGYTCQKGLRLFGQYEDEGQTALRFSTACTDGREFQGMLRVWDDLAFAQTAQGRAGATPTPTEFFETFRRLPGPAAAQPAP